MSWNFFANPHVFVRETSTSNYTPSIAHSRFPLSFHLLSHLCSFFCSFSTLATGAHRHLCRKPWGTLREINIGGTTAGRSSSILHYIEAGPPIHSRFLDLERPPLGIGFTFNSILSVPLPRHSFFKVLNPTESILPSCGTSLFGYFPSSALSHGSVCCWLCSSYGRLRASKLYARC